MPHAHLLNSNKIKEHLAGFMTYIKLNSNLTQAIRNGILSTLDFLDSAQLVDDRESEIKSPHGGLYVLHFCIILSAPPKRSLQVLYFSMASPKPTRPTTKASLF